MVCQFIYITYIYNNFLLGLIKMLESVWFQLASWTIFYHETSFRFREFWIGNMQIPTLNKYIKSNQNKFIVETNALKEILIYLLFVIVIVVIITTATTIVPLLIGKKPHIFCHLKKQTWNLCHWWIVSLCCCFNWF